MLTVGGRSVPIMGGSPADARALLQAALGTRGRGSAVLPRLARARLAEDGALAAWSAAVTDYDNALQRRQHVLNRAEAGVHHRMAPLTPARYVRMEQALDRAKAYHRSPAWVRDMLHVQRARPAVNEARSRLACLTAIEDDKVAGARQTRATATADLTRALGLGRAARVTGLSTQQLGVMSAGR